MKRFRFRLEGLLRLRRVEEKRCLSSLRARQVEVADAQERQRELNSDRGRTIESLRRLGQGRLEMEEVLRHRRYLISLENRTREVHAEVIRRQSALIEAQRVTARAVRERQLVERLRERRRDDHELGVRRQEVRDLDEIGSGAAGRREAIG